jgi:hypothetical protein
MNLLHQLRLTFTNMNEFVFLGEYTIRQPYFYDGFVIATQALD